MKTENGEVGRIVEEAISLKEDDSAKSDNTMIYGILDKPPFSLTILFAIQHIGMSIGGIVTVPVVLTQIMGMGREEDAEYQQELYQLRARFISVSFFSCGLSTVVQVLLGVRLPLVQGSSFTFMPVVVTAVATSTYRSSVDRLGLNETNATITPIGWQDHVREISGSLAVASCVQVLVGATGVIGLVARYIGPLSISPLLILISMSGVDIVARNCSYHWGVSILSVLLVVVFGELLKDVKVPVPIFSRKKICSLIRLPLFATLPTLLSMIISWMVCWILTEANVLPTNSTEPAFFARTDAKSGILENVAWVSAPYIDYGGLPTISWAVFLGMLAATLSSIVESVGDYHAAAINCGVPAPTPQALSRGILCEGAASVVSGLLGACHAATSYSNNVAGLMLTRVSSRRVFWVLGIILMIMGVFSKVGAAFSLIPEPVIGGVLLMSLSIIISIAMSFIRNVNLSNTRNLVVLGLSIYAGIVVPRFLKENPHYVSTGVAEVDNVLLMILRTEIIVGGFLGLFLDLILPGTRKDRGFVDNDDVTEREDSPETSIYSCPPILRCASRLSWLPFIKKNRFLKV